MNLRTEPRINVQETALKLAGRARTADLMACVGLAPSKPGPVLSGHQPQKGCEFFDADRVGGKITLRHWRPGDRFQPIGLKSAVKLQDLFTNRKSRVPGGVS